MTPITDDFKIVTAEEAICLRCTATIPSINVSRQLVPLKGGRVAPTQQKVDALCPHCDTLYELTRELSGGQWIVISGVAIVTDRKRREAFKAKLSKLQGDIQIGKEARVA